MQQKMDVWTNSISVTSELFIQSAHKRLFVDKYDHIVYFKHLYLLCIHSFERESYSKYYLTGLPPIKLLPKRYSSQKWIPPKTYLLSYK